MLFSSMTFLFVFLPIVLFLYLVTKKELHNPILLLASIVFYAWGEPKYLAIMLISILVNYFGAIAIDKYNSHKKLALISTIVVNLGFLFYFKYFNFLAENINNIFHSNFQLIDVLMPIGISFYTFQALSYVIDVYRGECKVQKDIYKLALYICLFPQLIAGPIVKYHDVSEQIESREVNFDKVNEGVKRFIVGLSKTVIIGNTLASIVDKIFVQDPHTFSHSIAWLGSIAYSLQLYFDFSGYSDMAIGLGLIFGFRFMENFNYPYISKSITEFWKRWMISLSTWFKQYVYSVLGGNRGTKQHTIRNLAIVFLLTGIWHGAAWNFVIWGIWQGLFIIIEKIVNIKEIEAKYTDIQFKVIQHIYCILIFIIGWVIFRAKDMKYAFEYIRNMFGLMNINNEDIAYGFSYYAQTYEILIIIIAILCATPIFSRIKNVENKIAKSAINVGLLLLFILSASMIASNTYNPFIYFRF